MSSSLLYERLEAGVTVLIQPAGKEGVSVWLYKPGIQLSRLLRLGQPEGQD